MLDLLVDIVNLNHTIKQMTTFLNQIRLHAIKTATNVASDGFIPCSHFFENVQSFQAPNLQWQ